MRVLFTTWAQTGHYQPLVPLGWALRAAGHEVVVATHPRFAPQITRSGLPALPLGPDIDVPAELRLRARRLREQSALDTGGDAPGGDAPGGDAAVGDRHGGDGTATRMRTRDLPENRYGSEVLRVIVEGVEAMIDEALEFARSWRPDLVVFEPTGLLGPVLAAVIGVPTARQLWAPDMTAGLQAIATRLLASVLRRFDLDDIDITGTVTLDPCPPRMQVDDALARTPVRYIGYNGPATSPSWLLDPPTRPRVCLTWGTSLHTVGLRHAYLAPRVVKALGGLDVEVVVAALASQRQLFDRLPGNVVHFGPVPLLALLPGCAAVVHQSGAGTTMSSVISGVPQLAIATLQETAINGRLMASTGAGFHLLDEEATAERVRECLNKLLSEPSVRAAAGRLRDEAMSMPTPAETIPLLASLASRQGLQARR